MTEARPRSWNLLVIIDLIGTALFAARGASTAINFHLDLLGVLVLSFATAVGGGILRDLLIGDVPPSSIRDWRYPATAFLAGAAVFLLHLPVNGINFWVLTALDAAGLSFFAISGATKARQFKLHPLPAILMGGLTGVGGGTMRDLLTNRIPTVLRSDVYAAAALFGASITLLALRLRVPPAVATGLGIASCFTLRMLAVYFGWNLPGADV